MLLPVPTDGEGEPIWWRGCKPLINETNGCTEHKWFHNEKEMTVDECICDTDLCNTEMGPIVSTSTEKTTTPEGKHF